MKIWILFVIKIILKVKLVMKVKKTNNKNDKKSNNYEIINNQYNDLKTVDDYITYKNENI